MKNLLFLFLIGVVFSGCSNSSNTPSSNNTKDQINENQVVIENDMESAHGGIPSWNNEKTVVKMQDGINAHSGEFASRIDEVEQYSYAFRESFENLNAKLPQSVVVNGWYYLTEANEKATVAMDINENKETYIWKAFNLSKSNPKVGQWNEFTAEFKIDKPIKPVQQIKIYAYSGDKLMYLDDWKITFIY